MDLSGRTAFVTGGTQGVGAAIAIHLAKAGCDLILHGLHDDQMAEETVQACLSHGIKIDLITADLAVPAPEVIPSLVSQVHQLAPAVSILINNAGTFCDKPFLEMDWETYQKTMRLNVESGYFLTQEFAKRWIEHGIKGRVLFTGSINGELAEPGHTAYDTSKGAVRMMVRTLCVALAPHGIRVNAIAPGLVISPLTAAALTESATRWMELHTPNGKVPPSDVCGPAAVFLVSDQAEHIQGQTLLIDGGMSVWQQPDCPN
jgi:NAD(P)-dependent dehydrogenase (short-subunit alcohol dehydrogenase family)